MALPELQSQSISIHALREEGDPPISTICTASCKFLSTPSARRATTACLISGASRFDFYPRPPRGGRPRRRAQQAASCPNFYPRPPRGGRLLPL